jgi:hypothetical protein
MLIALKFIRVVLDKCLNKPVIIADRRPASTIIISISKN